MNPMEPRRKPLDWVVLPRLEPIGNRTQQGLKTALDFTTCAVE